MFRNKFSKKEDKPKMTTLEEVKKAYEDLSEEDKKSFHQSLKDRIDESVGEEEHIHEAVDNQDAKDSVDDALETEKTDEEKADGDKPETESEVSEETKEDAEAKTEGAKEPTLSEVFELVTKLSAEVAALRHAQETDKPVEPVGVDGDFADEIAPTMPASYLEQAKKMRY